MPNAPAQLRDKEKIWLCITHFEGEWKATQGGSKPVNLPTVFSGIPKSCLKQTNNKPRQSERSSSSARRKSSEEQDKVKSFADFIVNMKKKYPKFHFIEENGSLNMFRTDELGREVINFLQFIEVESPFGFLKLVLAEHKGIEIYKNQLGVPRNSLISKWSLVSAK